MRTRRWRRRRIRRRRK